MSLLEKFNECNSDGWTTAGLDVQYKVVGDTLFFQPSHGSSDWRYNFKAARSVYDNSDIPFVGHRGFNELWYSVRRDIEKLSFRKICGYSQGGALAVLAHENYYHRFGSEPDVTWTFGCPPSIFEPTLELEMRFSNVINWHNPRDIVYYAPMILGYKHVGQCRTLHGNVKRPDDCGLIEWISGHSPDEYRQRLEAML